MTTAARCAATGCLVLALVAASACSASPRRSAPPSTAPSVAAMPTDTATGTWRVEGTAATLASGLDAPWSVVPLDDGGALISQRDDGVVRELTPDGELRTAGTIDGVVSGGESGLHGLALLDDDAGPVLYAYFGADDDNRVVRMPLLGEAGEYDLGEPEVVISGIPRADTHDGGRIAFGPDGMLYVATGDARQEESAQDPDSLNGKILRLTPDGAPAPGNPWSNAAWSIGHRNVQGIAWSGDGTMWASEFGQDTWDELNRIESGGNYGWPVVEGVGEQEGFIDPVAVWATDDASPSGIAIVGDTVFLAALRGERVWAVDVEAGRAAIEPAAALVGEQGRLRDVVAAPDGSLWVLTNNTDGRGSPRAEDDLLLRVPIAPFP